MADKLSGQWCYIPPWSDTRIPKFSTINAKAETLADSKLWAPLLKQPIAGVRGRCLVLADGLYEWQKRVGGKQPFRMRLPSGDPFAFAGLYGIWRDKSTGSDVLSFTIVTCAPNALMVPIHDRMPVVLDEAAVNRGLTRVQVGNSA